MPGRNNLSAKRNEIKRQIGSYQSLPERILDGVGSLFGARGGAFAWDVTGIPAYWLSGAAIALFILAAGLGVSVYLREALSWRELGLMAWTAGTGSLALIANRVNVRLFLDTFSGSALDKILSIDDVRDLDRWLKANFSIKRPLWWGLILWPIPAVALNANWLISNRAAYHIGPFFVTIMACIEAIWVVYYFYPFYVSLPARLSRYHYDLYVLDPSKSEVVGRLSELLTSLLYVAMAFIVWLTLGLATFNVLTLSSMFIFSAFVWAPTVALYAAGQIHLSNLIMRAKWGVLNDIQTRIESFYARQDLARKDTLQVLQEMMDYHERVRNTANSALDLRSGLNFLNALLLPVLAASLERVVALVKDMTK